MANNNTTIIDQLNLLRSVLRSDDHLQINPSGDYEQVRIKLDHDIQISFFFDPVGLATTQVTISNIHDLRISKLTSKCPLTNEQWTDVRKYFDELIHKSHKTTSLYSVIQLIQDHLLRTTINNSKYKSKEKKSTNNVPIEDVSTTNNKFRGADLIFNRILYDKHIDRSQVLIGYEDRFTGIHEIAFNEFKKVHEHEYGIPMHRIRYYKINGRIVWDRTNKIDILTRSEQQLSDEIEQRIELVQGLYHFDQSMQQWALYPCISLSEDDSKSSSTNDTILPQQCHFVTWNILFDYHHSSLIHTDQRYPAILSTLRFLLPDVICLQEVTANFLQLLLNELWLQEHHYYIIIMNSVINSNKEKSYGQLILTKNFRPRSFSICPLDCSDQSVNVSSSTKKTTKEVIIARFGLTARTTIDLINVHLQSDLSREAEIKRCQALENFFKEINTNNFMLIGDFNFGDYSEKEQNLLQKYNNDVHDLWKEMYNLNEEPGFTFDPSNNTCAHITSISQTKRRLDRYLLHTLQNLSYSLEHLTMIGIDSIPIDRLNNDDDKRIHLSDHYGLQLMIRFQTRSISHRSAIVLLPTSDHWTLIDDFRQQYDPSFGRWPPHINLLWPFFDLNDSQSDEENILLPLRLLLSQYQSFTAKIVDIDKFVENNICFMKLNQNSTEQMKKLYERLKDLFPQCCINNRNNYNPHMTIAQFDSTEKRNQVESSLHLKQPFDFPVEYLYLLQRPYDDDTKSFHITHQIPLGSILQPLGINRTHCVDFQLQDLFHSINLYENKQSYEKKFDKFNKLSQYFNQLFNKETLHCFTHTFLPYGSFRIGINGSDVDTIFVLDEIKSFENNPTTFDQTLQQLKDNDRDALKNYIIDFLERQIKENLKDEIFQCRKVQALYPIIYILFNDHTKVEICVQIRACREHSYESIHGVLDIEHLFIHARSPPIFQHLLLFIRSWAQQVGFYGQPYGYLGGYTWAILCAHICHKFLSSIPSLSFIEHFSIDQFFSLVCNFFYTYANFSWSSDSLCLHPTSSKQINQLQKSSAHSRGIMRIISPIPPFKNSARSTIKSTRDLIVQGFHHVVELLDQINTVTTDDKVNALKQILQMTNEFPASNIKSALELTLSCENENDLDEWIGWMKSRLAYFLTDCEQKYNYFVQTQNTIEYRSKTTQALYSIGFNVEEQVLYDRQSFLNRLTKFFDDLYSYTNRKETMKISHRIISIHDWKLERMQPKPQRIKK